jgi:hypothetical protein
MCVGFECPPGLWESPWGKHLVRKGVRLGMICRWVHNDSLTSNNPSKTVKTNSLCLYWARSGVLNHTADVVLSAFCHCNKITWEYLWEEGFLLAHRFRDFSSQSLGSVFLGWCVVRQNTMARRNMCPPHSGQEAERVWTQDVPFKDTPPVTHLLQIDSVSYSGPISSQKPISRQPNLNSWAFWGNTPYPNHNWCVNQLF